MKWTDLIGILAGICTMLSLLPQINRAWKTRQVKNVSLRMFIVLMLGLSLWFVYGIIERDLPIIATNGVSLALNTIMIYLMIKHR